MYTVSEQAQKPWCYVPRVNVTLRLHSVRVRMLMFVSLVGVGYCIQEAKELLEKFMIGSVKAGAGKPSQREAASVTNISPASKTTTDLDKPKVLLQDPKERYALPLVQKQQLNHDTFFMRFGLPSPEHRLGLPCGKHVFLYAGEPRTPISPQPPADCV